GARNHGRLTVNVEHGPELASDDRILSHCDSLRDLESPGAVAEDDVFGCGTRDQEFDVIPRAHDEVGGLQEAQQSGQAPERPAGTDHRHFPASIVACGFPLRLDAWRDKSDVWGGDS